ncbi:hypothetical protein G5B30_09385 [Sphingobacterium sp. SGG-5]|uniref:hypothetical protein n=1 Tax=Sphingobacterium sp. SGG-5 TaxID=2710881 RepID=UPI0013E9A4DC|nr:hypothetical protein [Sphingobacterium sp. SGG-5]NGM62125.1 hypothetical protein [Sphingobacterium sp. SGG-5]
MKEIVNEHPLRPIILQFEFDKPQMEFEKKGLDAHYLMHDLTWDMLQQLKAHNQALEEVDLGIAELDYMLLPLEQDLDILEVFLQIQDPSVLPFDEKDGEGEINIDLGSFYESVRQHNKKLQELHAEMLRENQWFEQHFDMIYEKESWIDSDLWNDIHQIYRNYLQAQVDIVTLDRDQEEFRGTLSEVFDYQDGYREYGEAIFEAYTRLHERSEKNYRRAEVVNEALNKMQR